MADYRGHMNAACGGQAAGYTAGYTEIAMGAKLSYDEALMCVMGLADFERSTHSPGHSAFHLERMRLLMARLGDAHLATPTAHIAGTKGKGSTAAMAASILAAAGYKVGMYSSPHLHSATERIRVNMRPISRREFADVVACVWPAVEHVGANGGYGGVTTFEALTAMAFTHFARIGADYQVIEVGLGGRLDATNIVKPQACAITSISLDHTATLGNTIAKIAAEKAGIIKPGAPVAAAPQRDEAMAVIRQAAAERGAELVPVGERYSWRGLRADMRSQTFRLYGPRRAYELETQLLGDYQMENAATAVALVEALEAQGTHMPEGSVERGMRATGWDARLQTLSTPEDGGLLLVVDGAHNPYSMERLADAVRRHFAYRRLIVVFGALGGHSAAGMLAALAPLAPVIVAAQSRHPRSAPGATIAAAAKQAGLDVAFSADDVASAVRYALSIAGADDMVLGTGSLSVAAEVIEEARGIPPELYPYMDRVRG